VSLKPFNLQEFRVDYARWMEELQELEHPMIYHIIAYRYACDAYIDLVTECFDEVVSMTDQLLEQAKHQNMMYKDFPPIISARIDEIIEAHMIEHPDTTDEERELLVGSLFLKGGEFDGLYDEENNLNKDWLEQYLSDNENKPRLLNIPLTEQMAKDVLKINEDEALSEEEKHEKASALFLEGGKYEGYLQLDGRVDADKIKDEKVRSANL
jgi:hypothetical protein